METVYEEPAPLPPKKQRPDSADYHGRQRMILRNANSATNTFKASASANEVTEESPRLKEDEIKYAELNVGIYEDMHESYMAGVDSQADEKEA